MFRYKSKQQETGHWPWLREWEPCHVESAECLLYRSHRSAGAKKTSHSPSAGLTKLKGMQLLAAHNRELAINLKDIQR